MMKILVTGRAYSGVHFMNDLLLAEGLDSEVIKPSDVERYVEDHSDLTICAVLMQAIENIEFQGVLARHGITTPDELDAVREGDGWAELESKLEDTQLIDIPFVMHVANSFRYAELDESIEELKGLDRGLSILYGYVDQASTCGILNMDGDDVVVVYEDGSMHKFGKERFTDLLWRDDEGLGRLMRQVFALPPTY